MEFLSLKRRRPSLERAKVAKCEDRLVYLHAIDRPFHELCGVHNRSQGKIQGNFSYGITTP